MLEQNNQNLFRCGIRCTEDVFFTDKTYSIPRDIVEMTSDYRKHILNLGANEGGFLIIDKDTGMCFWQTTFSMLRRILGVSQRNLVAVMNIPRRTIEDWEAGRKEPPEYVQNLIAAEMCKLIRKKYK